MSIGKGTSHCFFFKKEKVNVGRDYTHGLIAKGSSYKGCNYKMVERGGGDT